MFTLSLQVGVKEEFKETSVSERILAGGAVITYTDFNFSLTITKTQTLEMNVHISLFHFIQLCLRQDFPGQGWVSLCVCLELPH